MPPGAEDGVGGGARSRPSLGEPAGTRPKGKGGGGRWAPPTVAGGGSLGVSNFPSCHGLPDEASNGVYAGIESAKKQGASGWLS